MSPCWKYGYVFVSHNVENIFSFQKEIKHIQRHIKARMDLIAGYENPEPSPRIDVTQNPICADYYIDWMLCHVTALFGIRSMDYTDVDTHNYYRYGEVQFVLKFGFNFTFVIN